MGGKQRNERRNCFVTRLAKGRIADAGRSCKSNTQLNRCLAVFGVGVTHSGNRT